MRLAEVEEEKEQHKKKNLHLSVKASNSTSPFENWNLTALSKVTAATVILFNPSVIGIAGPKNQFPFAVVLATLKLAPFAVSVTFIVKVCAP